MKRKFVLIGLMILLGVGAFLGYYLVIRGSTEPQVDTRDEAGAQTNRVEGVKDEVDLDSRSKEGEVLDIMNQMTHQKIKASDKWGAVEMTDEHIQQVKEVVEKSDFKHRDLLLSILNKWSAGDFSTVDEDHNKVWLLQHGNIGRAYGILSKEQEQQFIENNFEK
ncbi:DUF6241 domain-containing protein [Falsibacillus albus]|uniref:CTP synthase n=1 Tax=Falsibacillus albus TaxID=2478915 RepID=A0A3L7KA30_9BACI|nr:DUF6241 domain-containing protein [Falsibacillus albus]RLQ97512.1 hypothetical protein D9X91_05025 [Falsibacillus albus]